MAQQRQNGTLVERKRKRVKKSSAKRNEESRLRAKKIKEEDREEAGGAEEDANGLGGSNITHRPRRQVSLRASERISQILGAGQEAKKEEQEALDDESQPPPSVQYGIY